MPTLPHIADEPTYIEETAREVMRETSSDSKDIAEGDKYSALQEAILKAQYEAERDATPPPEAGKWFVSDWSALDCLVYARAEIGDEAADGLAESPAWKDMLARMRRGCVVLFRADASVEE